MENFGALSPLEFTNLVADLLSEELKEKLKISPAGPDAGIDIQLPGKNARPLIVVQCKHFSKSSISKLLSELKKEIPKVLKINPERYMVATSLSITPDRRKDICLALENVNLAPADVFGNEDLQMLLRNFPKVQTAHYKLWMTSSTVLQHILINGSSSWNSLQREAIEKKLQIYVQVPAYPKALRKLEGDGCVIITGPAGVGKTTLAQALIAKCIEDGYTLVDLDSLENPKQRIVPDQRQVVFYDDFLGSSSLADKLRKNEDHALVQLVDLARTEKNLRLVLTTRTYLIQQAKQIYEKLNRKEIEECFVPVTLNGYSFQTKFMILYNHLHFKGVGATYIRALSRSGMVGAILSHVNFNPRLIEMCSTSAARLKVSPEKFVDFILESLRDPSDIYQFAIEYQLSSESRNVLIAMAAVGNNANLYYVEAFWTKLLGPGRQGGSRTWRAALKELDGSFISILENEGSITRVRFLNAGVQESVRGLVSRDSGLLATLINSAEHPVQLVNLGHCLGEAFGDANHTSAGIGEAYFSSWRRLLSFDRKWLLFSWDFLISCPYAARSKKYIALLEDVITECYSQAKEIDSAQQLDIGRLVRNVKTTGLHSLLTSDWLQDHIAKLCDECIAHNDLSRILSLHSDIEHWVDEFEEVILRLSEIEREWAQKFLLIEDLLDITNDDVEIAYEIGDLLGGSVQEELSRMISDRNDRLVELSADVDYSDENDFDEDRPTNGASTWVNPLPSAISALEELADRLDNEEDQQLNP